jgi:hypothetical protein
MSAILITRCKNERNISEWVNYHLSIGFDKICIYDDISTIPVSDVIKNKNVHIIRTDKIISLHGRSTNSVYDYLMEYVNKNNFKYVMDLDIDEYLYLSKYKNLKQFLGAFEPFTAIKINWLNFGSNNLENRELDSLIYSFTKSQRFLTPTCKTIAKTSSISGKKLPHNFVYEDNSKQIFKNIKNKRVGNRFQGRTFFCEKYKLNISQNRIISAPVCIFHYKIQDLKTFYDRKTFINPLGYNPYTKESTNKLTYKQLKNNVKNKKKSDEISTMFIETDEDNITNNLLLNKYNPN